MMDNSPGWLSELLNFSSDRSLTILLYSLLLLLFVVYPFLLETAVGRIAIDGFFALILLSGALAVRRFRRIALVTVVIVLGARLFVYVQPTQNFVLVSTFLTIVFLTFACGGILRRVFATGRITRSRIEGAVAVYLLIGLILALVYAIIAIVRPDAFNLGEFDWAMDNRTLHQQLFRTMTYFSFVTLTTVGYGDITPVSDLARQISVLEGLVGQLYPAILLARLVSMELSQKSAGTREDEEDGERGSR